MAAIYLIRHGQASWGQADYDVLSEVGIQQARMLGSVLRERIAEPQQIIVGAMRRHRETAEHTLSSMSVQAEWVEDQRWNEYDHLQLLQRVDPGFEDRKQRMGELMQSENPRQSFQELFERAIERWIGRQFDHEYAETWSTFKARIAAALEDAIQGDGNTLVFTSGGAIGAVVKQLWQLPDQSWPHVNRVIANATITKVVRGRSGLHLSTFNEHSHFEGQHRQLLTYR